MNNAKRKRAEQQRRKQMQSVPLLCSNGLIYSAKTFNTAPVFTLIPGPDGICRPHEVDVPCQIEPEFAKTGYETLKSQRPDSISKVNEKYHVFMQTEGYKSQEVLFFCLSFAFLLNGLDYVSLSLYHLKLVSLFLSPL